MPALNANGLASLISFISGPKAWKGFLMFQFRTMLAMSYHFLIVTESETDNCRDFQAIFGLLFRALHCPASNRAQTRVPFYCPD